MATDQALEREIHAKGPNAPRLRIADIDAVIIAENYTVLRSGRTTICELTLKNGFTVVGESSCVSQANFDAELGKKISRIDAWQQIWPLEAYLLKQRLFELQNGAIPNAAD